MRRFIAKVLMIALALALIPVQIFAMGPYDDQTSKNGVTQTGGSILVNANPVTQVYASTTGGQNFDKPLVVDVIIRADAAPFTGQTNTFGLGATQNKLEKIQADWKLSGATNNNGGGLMTKKIGSEHQIRLPIRLDKVGTYYLTGQVSAYYQRTSKPYTKPFSITLKVSEPPAGPSCSIIGPSSGVVGKTYNFSGTDRATDTGTVIKKRAWSLNSTSANFKQSGNTATMTPSAPSPYYNLTYTVTDSAGRTATATKTVNIVPDGPIITLKADTPLAATQKGNVSMTVDTKGLALTYRWSKFDNAVDFIPPTPTKAGSFRSTTPGEYIITVTATDSTGKTYAPISAKIQVVGPIQAAISAPATVKKGSPASAKDISTILAPMTFENPISWKVTEPGGTIKNYTTAPKGSVNIDTSKLGTHMISLTVKAAGTNLTSTISRPIQVVENLPTAAPPANPGNGIYPDNMEDLLDFNDFVIPDAAGALQHSVALSGRGYTGSCINSATKQNHIGEKSTGFQYWKVSVNLSEHNASNQPMITPIMKDKKIDNDNPNAFSITFDKAGKYQVVGVAWHYCEKQGTHTHYLPCSHTPKHGGSHKHCSFLQYQGGAIIEPHGGIGPYEVVITQEMVGKPIMFDKDWKQKRVKTKSYLID